MERLYTVVFYGTPTVDQFSREMEHAKKLFPADTRFTIDTNGSTNDDLVEYYLRVKEQVFL
jgi:hypothetical protein